jgi:hypothetical protein
LISAADFAPPVLAASSPASPNPNPPNPASPTPSPPIDKVQALRQQIRRLETAARCGDGRVISTGCPDLDELLPERGLSAGTITEWLTPAGGHGARVLSLLAARQACADGGALVVIDPERSFFAPAAAAWGIDPDNVIVLRPPPDDHHALYWAIDQSLRCSAVAAVWGALPRLHEQWQRRFQLSAEESGALGLFVRPASLLGDPGWSEVQWLVGNRQAGTRRGESDTAARKGFDRFIDLRLVRIRNGTAGACVRVQLDFTSGQVRKVHDERERPSVTGGTAFAGAGNACPVQKHTGHLAALLAHPATGGRRQRA